MNGATVQFEDWHVWIQVVAFTIIFLAFCYFTMRTLLMKKDREQKLASMPLDDGIEAPEKPDTKHTDTNSISR